MVAITAGLDPVCALIADGTVRCWGLDDSGELGNGSVNPIGFPMPGTVSRLGRRGCRLAGSPPVIAMPAAVLGDGTVAMSSSAVAVGW